MRIPISEHTKNYRRNWYLNNREKALAYARKWLEKNPEKARENHQKWRLKCKTDRTTWARNSLARIRHDSKRHGVRFALSLEDILEAMPKDGLCPVFGVQLIFGGKLHRNTATIDKVIPAKGYIPGNIGVISCRANRMKLDATGPDEIRKIADYMETRIKLS